MPRMFKLFGKGKRAAQPKDALGRIEALVYRHLPEDADEETRALVVAIAGLLACVAYADRKYSEAEQAHVREALGRVHGLSPAGVSAICETLEQDLLEVASSNPQQHTRRLRELGDVELRREVLDALVDLAAADDELTMTETELLRRTTSALGLSQDDYNAAQARHRERLSVLK
jgi:uncharacterized tellurite resistance protein B-like protein